MKYWQVLAVCAASLLAGCNRSRPLTSDQAKTIVLGICNDQLAPKGSTCTSIHLSARAENEYVGFIKAEGGYRRGVTVTADPTTHKISVTADPVAGKP